MKTVFCQTKTSSKNWMSDLDQGPAADNKGSATAKYDSISSTAGHADSA